MLRVAYQAYSSVIETRSQKHFPHDLISHCLASGICEKKFKTFYRAAIISSSLSSREFYLPTNFISLFRVANIGVSESTQRSLEKWFFRGR